MKQALRSSRQAAGFSLVELTIVVVILGVLALMGVPRYRTAVERGKAIEAYTYLAQVAKAQEMHLARTGRFADALSALAIEVDDPQHFAVGSLTSFDWETQWNLRLTRQGASSGYGAYTVVFSEGGFDAARSSIPAALSPTGQGGVQSVTRGSGSSSSGNSSSSGGSTEGASDGGSGATGEGSGGGNAGNGPNPDAGNSDQENRGRGNGEGGGRDGNRGGGRGGR